MALIPCKSCNHSIDSGAKTCPQCGATNQAAYAGVRFAGLIYLALIAALFYWIWGLMTPAEAATSPIAEHCQNEWPDDAQMRSHCGAEQEKARRALSRYSGPILERCEQEWLPDYGMTLYCVKEQTAAAAVVDAGPKDEITARCVREWPDEFDMQKSCAEERRAAKATIERLYSGPGHQQCQREWGTEYEMVLSCIEDSL